MEKNVPTCPTNQQNVPVLGPGTSTSSGVTVFSATTTNNTNPPPPPSYDQAMGNPTANAGPSNAYNTAAGWSAPGIGAPNNAYNIPTAHTTTTYTTYATSMPPPQQQPSQPAPFGQPPVVIIQRKFSFLRSIFLKKIQVL